MLMLHISPLLFLHFVPPCVVGCPNIEEVIIFFKFWLSLVFKDFCCVYYDSLIVFFFISEFNFGLILFLVLVVD